MNQFYQLIQLFTRIKSSIRSSLHRSGKQCTDSAKTDIKWFTNLFSFSIIILILFSYSNTVSAANIISVQSINIKPYNDALKGFQSACNCSIEQFIISEMYGTDINARIQISKPEIIIAIGSKALESVKDIKETPIISLMVLNPQSLFPDHDNISGIDMFISPEKQLLEITKLIPHVKTIGLLFDPARTGNYIKDAKNASIESDINIIAKEVNDPKELPSLLNSMKDKIDAFWMIPDLTVINQEAFELVSLFSIENNIPIITFSKSHFNMGILISLDIDSLDMGRQAWVIADKILSEDKSRRSKTVYARSLIPSINQKTVKNFGMITVNNMLIRAIVTKTQ